MDSRHAAFGRNVLPETDNWENAMRQQTTSFRPRMSHRVIASLRHTATAVRHQPNIYRDWLDAPCPVLMLDGRATRRRPAAAPVPSFRFRAGNAGRDRARLLRCLRYLDPRLVLAPDRVTWRRFQHVLQPRPADPRPRAMAHACLTGPLVTEWLFVAGLHRLVQVVRPAGTRRPGAGAGKDS